MAEPRPARKKPRSAAKKAARKREPARPARSEPLHAPPVDAAAAAAAPPPPAPAAGPSVAAAPAAERGAADGGGSPAVAAGFLALLAAAGLALAFAAIPARALGTVSTRLTEHRNDIGLAVMLAMAVSAMVLVLVAT
ncbi:MAG TPA: hypothetical protein VD704_08700 [Gaiellaceae bacterium]|nr:hypothetical protein [Gaiellaceae bacterium]